MKELLGNFQNQLKTISDWISTTIDANKTNKIPMGDLSFDRIPKYFSKELLNDSFVVYCDELPIPPLKIFELDQYSEMESRDFTGITYKNHFFIKERGRTNEILHFHEMIHLVQWKYLGLEKFLLCYAHGLLNFGYRNSPIENMAYNHQDKFEAGDQYNAEKEVIKEMSFFDNLVEEIYKANK